MATQTENDILQEAIHENTSSERLKTLFYLPNPHIKAQLAKNPNTPPELLNKLAQHSELRVRKNTAMNPSTPQETLLCLANEFPKSVLNNPVFPLLLLETPNLVKNIPFNSLLSLLKCEDVPLQFMDWAINKYQDKIDDFMGISDGTKVFFSLAINPKTSQNILKLIEKNISDSNIQESAKLHINNRGEIKENIEEEIAQAVLNTNTISRKFKEKLLEFSQIQLTLPLIPQKFSPISLSLEEIANHPFTPQHKLAELAYHLDWEIRYGVAKNSNTSATTLKYLADDSHWWVKQEVARNLNTPPQILAKLVQGENRSEILKTLALNPHTPLTVLQHLNQSTTHPEIAEIISFLLSRKSSTDSLKKVKPLSEMLTWEQRHQWATNPQTPPDFLEQLARDPDLAVRVGVANNPNTPTRILVEFARETELTFSQKCKDYPLNSESLLGQLLNDNPSYFLQQEAIKNPQIPARVISQLFQDYIDDHQMCSQVAKVRYLSWKTLQNLMELNQPSLYLDLANNPFIPVDFLGKILKTQLNGSLSEAWLLPLARYFALKPNGFLEILPSDQGSVSYETLFLISLMPQTPAKLLFELVHSSDWLQRYVIAIHPNSPEKVIRFLSKDANRIIRAAARSRLS